MCINRTWADTHPSSLHTNRGISSLFVGSRTRMNDVTRYRRRTRINVRADAAMTSLTTSDQYESQSDIPTTLLSWAWTATLTRKNLKMIHLTKPSWMIMDQIYSSLTSLTPTWFRLNIYGAVCGFHGGEEVWYGPLSNDPSMHGCPKTRMVIPCTRVGKSVIAQMTDNARILMATRTSLRRTASRGRPVPNAGTACL